MYNNNVELIYADIEEACGEDNTMTWWAVEERLYVVVNVV